MMENKLSCAIVRDLLPSYVDGLTGKETTQAVDSHLADCPDCRATLGLMKEPEPSNAADVKEVDYLKKVRRRGSCKSLIVGIVLMLLGLAIFGFRIFYVGLRAEASDVVFDIEVNGDDIELTARSASSGLGISRVTFSDSNGMVQVMVYTAPKTFFNSGDYTTSYNASHAVGRVCIDDIILWEDGQTISRTAARLFAASNPYIGDMPANAKIAAILEIFEQFGSFTNELQTSAEPYGWTVVLNDPIGIPGEELMRDKMAVNSCVMLATVENLGYVTWRYQTSAGLQEFTFTADEASSLSGCDIKTCCDCVTKLQTLLRTLGIR